jgi:hypothetical protein
MWAMAVFLALVVAAYLIPTALPALPRSVLAERGVRLTLCTWLTAYSEYNRALINHQGGRMSMPVVVHQEPDGENHQHKQYVHSGILHAASVLSLDPDQGAKSVHAVAFFCRSGGAVICMTRS